MILATVQTTPRKSHPLLCLLMVAGCSTAADLLLKRGALASVTGSDSFLATLGITALASPFTIVGILFHISGLGAWMYTLRTIPLAIAYSFAAVQQATIFLGAWLWLGESITPLRWVGISCVLLGVLLLVPAIVQTEKATDGPPALPEALP